MDVILAQDVNKLGKAGEVVKVKDGYARNLLFPNKMAFVATATNLKKIELIKKKKQLNYDKLKNEAEEYAVKINKVSCTISVEVNDLDKLYGSITQVDIAKALETEGVHIDKKDIHLENPIEELGIFEVGVQLHPEVTAKVRLWVTKK